MVGRFEPRSLSEAALLDAVGLLRGEEAIQLAVERLMRDEAPPAAIVELAGMPSAANDEWHSLFRQALQQCGLQELSTEDAAHALVLVIARRIADGETEPIDGATFIWTELWQPWKRDDVAPFVALLDELEDQYPPTAGELAAKIKDYAAELVRGTEHQARRT